jgi:hypothetical protein
VIRSARERPGFHTYRRNPGLGSMNYYDLLAQVPRRDCDPFDVACVAQNQADVTAVQDYWDTHMYLPGGVPDGTQLSFAPLSAGQIQQFTQNITPTGVMRVDNVPYVSQVGPSPIVTTQTLAAPPATQVAYKPGTLSFQTSRGGSTLQPGDTWTVSIRGATSGTSVSVVGGKNGAVSSTLMGVTDANGNFSLSGTIGSDQIGTWAEQWYVSSVLSGSFSFTVVAPTTPAGQMVTVSNGADQAPGAKKDEQAATPSTSLTDWLQASILGGGIPNWALVAGGVAAIFMFSGGGRGR